MAKRLVRYSEERLAECVVDWLEEQGMEVYQEVQVNGYGSIADIVATVANRVWIIEVKKSLSLSLMAQADHWRRRYVSHWVSVAVPAGLQDTKGKSFARSVLRDKGIGILEVDPHGYSSTKGEYLIDEPIRAKLFRKARSHEMLVALDEEHKVFAKAGTKNGARWTPFQRTCSRLREHVLKNQGCSMKEAIESVDHHYCSFTSARSALRTWIEQGTVKGLKMEREGRTVRLYAESQFKTHGVP